MLRQILLYADVPRRRRVTLDVTQATTQATQANGAPTSWVPSLSAATMWDPRKKWGNSGGGNVFKMLLKTEKRKMRLFTNIHNVEDEWPVFQHLGLRLIGFQFELHLWGSILSLSPKTLIDNVESRFRAPNA